MSGLILYPLAQNRDTEFVCSSFPESVSCFQMIHNILMTLGSVESSEEVTCLHILTVAYSLKLGMNQEEAG